MKHTLVTLTALAAMATTAMAREDGPQLVDSFECTLAIGKILNAVPNSTVNEKGSNGVTFKIPLGRLDLVCSEDPGTGETGVEANISWDDNWTPPGRFYALVDIVGAVLTDEGPREIDRAARKCLAAAVKSGDDSSEVALPKATVSCISKNIMREENRPISGFAYVTVMSESDAQRKKRCSECITTCGGCDGDSMSDEQKHQRPE